MIQKVFRYKPAKESRITKFMHNYSPILLGVLSLSCLLFNSGCAVSGSKIPVNTLLCLTSEDSVAGFEFEKIYEAMDLAHFAYKDSLAIHEAYHEKYSVEIIALPTSAGQVILIQDSINKVQKIGIRGTVSDEVKSILTDAQYTKKKDPKLNIYVHTGFQKAVAELYSLINTKLNKEYTTHITGHSLGGALSVLLAYYLTEDGYPLAKTITFGQPKVTNKEGVTKYKEVDLLRIINDKDPVAYVPPLTYMTSLNSPYQHAGGALVLHDSLKYEYVCSEASQVTFVTELWSDIIGKKEGIKGSFLQNVSNHREKNYIRKLMILAGVSEAPTPPVTDSVSASSPDSTSSAPEMPAAPETPTPADSTKPSP